MRSKAQQLGHKDRADPLKDGVSGKPSSIIPQPSQSMYAASQSAATRSSKQHKDSSTVAAGSSSLQSHQILSAPHADQKMQSGKNAAKVAKKEVRPLSGGISQKQFSSKGDSRSRVASQHHNLSMFDKIGAN